MTKEKKVLTEHGITHVLSLGHRPETLPDNCENLFFDIADVEESDISPVLPEAVAFITQAIESGGKVFVHCFAGVSRSGSCVVAYMMAS